MRSQAIVTAITLCLDGLRKFGGVDCVDMNDKWAQKRFMDVQDKDRWKVIDDSPHTSFS